MYLGREGTNWGKVRKIPFPLSPHPFPSMSASQSQKGRHVIALKLKDK